MAEILSRKSSKNEEISLTDIYLRISDCYGDSIGKTLRQLEIQTELEQCIAITPMVMLYNQYVNDSSKKVFITSDMYLPKDVIVDILKRNGIKKPQCLYVSCKEQQTKRSGRLFRVLRNENGIKKKAMLHIGDNPISDYLMAKLNGVDSYLIM